MLQCPEDAAGPPLDVAGSADEKVLQAHLGLAAVAGLPQSVSAFELADRPFDAAAVLVLLLEGLGLLFLAAGLHQTVVLAHFQPAMGLIGLQTLGPQRALRTMGGPLKAVFDPAALFVLHPAALGVGPTGRTHRPALLHPNLEGLHRETAPAQRWGTLGGANELSAFGLRLGQFLPGDVSAIDILYRRRLPTPAGLLG